jgi:uncharacterized protein
MENSQIKIDYIPWKYFLIAYTFSWTIWLPAVLASYGFFELNIPSTLIIGIGAFGPLVGAFAGTYRQEKREGVIRLLKKAIILDFNKLWLIAAFLLLPLLIGVSFFIYTVLAGNEAFPQMPLIMQPWLILPLFLFSVLALGALQEEFGWRGYALEKIAKRFNALLSSLILGAFWALWHLPLFFIEGTMQSRVPFVVFFINVLSTSVLYTWLYNNTKKSLFAVLIFHGMHNTAFNIFPITLLPSPTIAMLLLTALQTIAAGLIILLFGFKKLERPTR